MAGGRCRADSVERGLTAAKGASYVLVHDAARPLVGAELIGAVVDATLKHGAAVPALAVADTVKQIDPDCAGAALGIRVYPGTPMAAMVQAEGPPAINPNILRHYEGPMDLLQPTFYISHALGPNPARLVRRITGDDPRFFPPEMEDESGSPGPSDDHNYNENQALIAAIDACELPSSTSSSSHCHTSAAPAKRRRSALARRSRWNTVLLHQSIGRLA